MRSCSTCRWWRQMGSGLGYCRRYPPVLSSRDVEGFERVADKDMSCGEWTAGSFEDWRRGK
ncbi:MAG: hypothetical protein JNK67_25775 [Alphaproteobacteria bacterium]|nr:hypothetical protein [Alphaproteobacteria bacterium]